MTVLFKAGESLEEWYAYAPDVGNVEPGISMVTTPVFKGSRAYRVFRAGLDTQPHTMINWDHNWNGKDLYGGFALYIPSDFDAPDWCVIHEFSQENPFKKNFVLYYNYDGYFGTEALQVVTWAPDDSFHLLYRQTLPRDQWITIIFHVVAGHADGRVELWIDGVPVYDSGLMDLAFEKESLDSYMLGIYCDPANPTDMTLYFDEAVIANTLQDVINELTPSLPVQSPVVTITVLPALIPVLTLEVDKAEGYIGDTFNFTGSFMQDGSAVVGETVTLYRNGLAVGSAVTDGVGDYLIPWVADVEGTLDFHSEAASPPVLSKRMGVGVETSFTSVAPALLALGIGLGLIVAAK